MDILKEIPDKILIFSMVWILRMQCTKIGPPSCNAYMALKQYRNHSNLYIVGISNEQGIHNNDDRRYVIKERGVTRRKPQF